MGDVRGEPLQDKRYPALLRSRLLQRDVPGKAPGEGWHG